MSVVRFPKLFALMRLALSLPLALAAQEQPTLRPTVQEFLKTWYIDREYDRLTQYVAKDNAFSYPVIRVEMSRVSQEAAWQQIFRQAFPATSARIGTLREAISYSTPSLPPGSPPLRYVNMNARGQVGDPFAIVDPASAPPGSLFPRTDASPEQRSHFDGVARYLDHLNRDYIGRLYVVLYATKGTSMLHETAVLYWILEDHSWRLAMFQGTDW